MVGLSKKEQQEELCLLVLVQESRLEEVDWVEWLLVEYGMAANPIGF
jgi:hypothetical protein